MSDVFLSYASEDRERAAQLAHALGHRGWTVWWDRQIIAGQAFDRAIEHELQTARSVVVLWSVRSIESEWVKNEAAVAVERGVLVPALIDQVQLPLAFRGRQTADLVGWQGNELHPGFQGLCQGVAHAMGAVVPPRPRPVAQPASSRARWLLPALALLALAGGLVLYALYAVDVWHAERAATAPAPTPVPASAVAPTAGQPEPSAASARGLADLVAGTYQGDVIADSQGPSRSDVEVTLTRIDRVTVRITSDYSRIETVEIPLTRNGNQIFAAEGDTPFIVNLDNSPPTLNVNPRSELAYRGIRRP